jgi:hypothetical protein
VRPSQQSQRDEHPAQHKRLADVITDVPDSGRITDQLPAFLRKPVTKKN